ncbi:hypothetical protein B6U82_00875 [Candidatus Pacearchaeota archaeon ex4484_31]|nr:MAG: hypothetical protein B6U82_00875 [Candidatus Pacearchaeota archaeon ex4484_31]
MNRKAQAGEVMQDTVALIVIVFLIIILFIFSNNLIKDFGKKVIQISENEKKLFSMHTSLYSFLRSHTKVQENEVSVADLIRLAKIDPHYLSYLSQEKEKLDKLGTLLIGKESDCIFYVPSNETIVVGLKNE